MIKAHRVIRLFVAVIIILSGLLVLVPRQASASSVSLEPTRDTYVDSAQPNSSYGSIGLGTVYHQPADSSSGLLLLHFDLSSIPAGSTISSATLTMRLGGCINSDPSSGHIGLAGYMANGSPAWTESSTYGQLSTNGSSIDGFASSTVACTPGGYVNFDLSSVISYWVDGEIPNDGLVLHRVTGGGYWTRVFYTSEATASSRPKLTVNYEVPYEPVPTPDGGPAASSGEASASSGDDKKTSTNTVTASAAPEPLAPDTTITPPAKLTAKQAANGASVALSWEKSKTANVEKYRIYRKISKENTFIKITELDKSKLQFTDTKITEGAQHDYFVRAVRNDKESLNSPTATIVVQKTVPTKAGATKTKTDVAAWAYAVVATLLLLASLIAYKMLHSKHKKLHRLHHGKNETAGSRRSKDG